MNDDLISRKAAQEAILKCKEIMFNPDKEIAVKALESVPAAEADIRDQTTEEYHLYTEYRDGKPYSYRYGEPWVAQQLLMEGGYKTPEEAIEKWFKYLKSGRADGDKL